MRLLGAERDEVGCGYGDGEGSEGRGGEAEVEVEVESAGREALWLEGVSGGVAWVTAMDVEECVRW